MFKLVKIISPIIAKSFRLISSPKEDEKAEPASSNADEDYNIGWNAFVDGDSKTAFEKLEPLAIQGHVLAQWHVGILSKLKFYDFERAKHWFQEAHKNGHPNAPYQIGALYRNGQGVVQNHETAVKWFLKGAELGDADASYNLYIAYDQGLAGLQKNQENAFKYLLMAAEAGHQDSQHMAGMRFLMGTGVASNKILGYMWIEIAAFSDTFKIQPSVVGAYPRQMFSIEDSQDILDALSEEMSPEQISRAKELARECVSKDFKLNGIS